MLSIIIPTLNEAAAVESALSVLMSMQARGVEVIVVDGGSDDDTMIIAARHADQVLEDSPKGRASQMNAGAGAATGDVLFFLHADSLPPPHADQLILGALASGAHAWGRFDVHITGASPMLRVIERMMNLRSRWSSIATGDQGIFLSRAAFDAVRGFPDIPLMEDIAISRALKRLGPPACLREKMTTSGRRWEEHGVLKTMLLMWQLRAAYFFGADPARLALRYRDRG